MVELELLQRRERAVSRLRELEPPPVELSGLVQSVIVRLGLAEVRQRHEDDARNRQQSSEDEREAHGGAGASASP